MATKRPNPKIAAPLGSGYWQKSRGPLMSLAFMSPLLLFYEGAVLLSGPSAMRNGADVWLRQLLDLMGLGHYFLLPVTIAVILLAWHHTTGAPWQISPGTLCGMLAESLLLAGCLLMLAHFQGKFFDMTLQDAFANGATANSAAEDHLETVGIVNRAKLAYFSSSASSLASRLVSFVGAGIYEEALFRLILLSVLAAGLRLAGVKPRWSLAGAAVASSLAFAAAHYIGPHGDRLELYSFVFRFLAGGFFALLFVYRGFGITVGTHAAYDIVVGLLDWLNN